MEVEVVHRAARGQPVHEHRGVARGDRHVDVGVDRDRQRVARGGVHPVERHVDERRVVRGVAEVHRLDRGERARGHAELERHRFGRRQAELGPRGREARFVGCGHRGPRERVGERQRRDHDRSIGHPGARAGALQRKQHIELRGRTGRDVRRGRADRDDPIMIELPLRIDITRTRGDQHGQHGHREHRGQLHRTPRTPIEGMIGSDLNAACCE